MIQVAQQENFHGLFLYYVIPTAVHFAANNFIVGASMKRVCTFGVSGKVGQYIGHALCNPGIISVDEGTG